MSRPETERELIERAQSLAGLRLGHLAKQYGWEVPRDLRRHKGWVGRLMERALGVEVGNAAAADFAHLGVELKTIPVDGRGSPQESTFVCSVELAAPDEESWETSVACQKLTRVLWIPVLAFPSLPIGHRLIGAPLLWSPSPRQEAQLRQDWEAHMELIRWGYVESISAHDGQILQIRPKGATSASRTWGVGPGGEAVLTAPRAFYLRASFTAAILRENFALPS